MMAGFDLTSCMQFLRWSQKWLLPSWDQIKLLELKHFCIATRDTAIVMPYSKANVLCLQPQRSSIHVYTYTSLCACMCMCLCMCVCWMCVCIRVCMCTWMYVSGNYNTQNGIKLIWGLLYFNYLPPFGNWFVQYTPYFTDGYSMVDNGCGELSVIDNSLTLLVTHLDLQMCTLYINYLWVKM